MALRFRGTHIMKAAQDIRGRLSQKSGSILVYIVMLMVIFAVLGVAMVSLFSTSISSSATPNDTRRAFYHYESGVRYADSELVNNTPKFSKPTIGKLNTTTYKIAADGTFKLKIFGLDFRSLSKINDDTTLNVNLKVEKGLFPADFTIPITEPRIFLVIYDTIPGSLSDPVAAITGFTYQDSTHVNLALEDPIYVSEKQRVAFAVRPFQDNPVSQGGYLLLTRNAASIFPLQNGVIEVREGPALIDEKKYYFYDNRIDTEDPNYVKLTNIQNSDKSSFSLNVSSSSSYVILSPGIHIITAEGKSSEVTYTEKWYNQYGGSVYDRQAAIGATPESRKPDIEFDEEDNLPGVLSKVPDPGVINVFGDPGNRYLSLSASGGSFGAGWFKDTRPIGGIRNFCNQGGCLFNTGFRAFFIFNLTGANGDGFTFSVLNGSNNDNSSVGGDIDLSELLAYAGDSRTTSNPTSASDYLDGRSGLGLQAPKMAVEFDGKRNNQSQTICQDATTVNQGSRFDPDFSGADRDTVQYVFWGKDSSIFAPCRINTFVNPNTNKTYDDNRHDTVNGIWAYDSGSRKVSSPAVDSSDPANVKIYAGLSGEAPPNDAGSLIRLRPSDGAEEWSRNPDTTSGNDDDINSSPTLDSSGDIYIGNDSFLISRYNSSGTKDWSTTLVGNIEGKPFVSDTKSRVYAVTDRNPSFNARLYSLSKSGAIQWFYNIGTTDGDYTSSPVVRYDSNLDINFIYVGSLNNSLYVVQDDGGSASLVRQFSIPSGPIRSTPAINPITGDVYFGSDDNNIYAIPPLTGPGKFAVLTGGDVVSSPAVSGDGRKVYVGSNDGRLYIISLNADGSFNNTQTYPPSGDSPLGAVRGSPTIANDGAIIFGSDDGHLYALNPDGTLRWKYPAVGSIGAVRSKPAIGPDGIIYFGAEDGKLYAIDPAVNDPPNIQNLNLTPTQLDPFGSYSNNWFTEGPWAVRVEVQRSTTPNGSGKFEYTLKTWLKKCPDADCSNAVGKFFQNTRFEYDWANESIPIIPMTQTIELSNTATPPPGQLDFLHDRFDRFLFGFTSASTDLQTIEIRKFQLSFIRPNDPVASD